MNKMKFFIATLCCLFVMGSATAQFDNTRPRVDNLTVVWEGAPGYRPNTTFTFKATKNGMVYSNVFYGPGMWTPPMVAGSNTITTIYNAVNQDPFSTSTYSNYYNNSLVIGGPEYQFYYDTWNGKNWYMYYSKATATEWHFRIGQ
jgi:hypothetical protein